MAFQVSYIRKASSFPLLLLAFLQIGQAFGQVPENERFNCYPDDGVAVTERSCRARNCIWQNSSNEVVPDCFYNSSMKYGYKASPGSFSLGLRLNLKRYSNQPSDGIFKNSVGNAQMDAEFQTANRLRIVFRDASNLNGRFEVPVQKTFLKTSSKASDPAYGVNYTMDPFSMKIFRKDNGRVIWDTSVGAFVFADQFLQISTRLPSEYVYGFGEHEHSSFKHDLNWKTLGMFSRDQPPWPDHNLYGVHPFYMCVEDDGKAHGVLLLNSNAMDVTLQPTPALTYRTIGGMFDFYFFFGPSPEQVVQQYTELIGRPVMPPYWALGFQLCRYGYNHIDVVKETVARMKKYDIPQVAVRARYGAYIVEHVFAYLAPNFVSGRPA